MMTRLNGFALSQRWAVSSARLSISGRANQKIGDPAHEGEAGVRVHVLTVDPLDPPGMRVSEGDDHRIVRFDCQP